MTEFDPAVAAAENAGWCEVARWAGAFLPASSPSDQTQLSAGLECWFTVPASGTLYRRVATLSSWFRWLEDEAVTIGNPP